MNFERLKELFSNFENSNDIVHLVCDSDFSILWTGKVKDINKAVRCINTTATGFSSRLFNPKTNMYEDGFYIYVRRII